MRNKEDIEKFNSGCQIGEIEEQIPTTSSDQPQIIQLQQNMLNIDLVASASIRNSISSQATAEIATAALISAGVISKDNSESFISCGPQKS